MNIFKPTSARNQAEEHSPPSKECEETSGLSLQIQFVHPRRDRGILQG